MRTLTEVLKHKEAELQRIQQEIDVLRTAMRLCSEDESTKDSPPVKMPATSEDGPSQRNAQVVRQFP